MSLSTGDSDDESVGPGRKTTDVTGDRMKAAGKERRQSDESGDEGRNESGLSEEMLRETVGEEEREDQGEAPLSKTAKSVLEDLFSDKSGQSMFAPRGVGSCVCLICPCLFKGMLINCFDQSMFATRGVGSCVCLICPCLFKGMLINCFDQSMFASKGNTVE